MLAQHAGASHAVELGGALDDHELMDEAAGEYDLGAWQAVAQIVILVDRHVILVARIDLDQADARLRQSKLADAFDHPLRIAATAALAHVGERRLDLATHRLG